MAPALLALIVAIALSACGGERTFAADEFVEEANRQGAALALREPLASTEEGVEVFEVAFAEEAHAGEPEAGEGGHAHTGGSLVLAEDADAAAAEYERCESAVSLTCYRAANVVLMFEGEPTDPEISRVDAAIRALGSD